MAEFKYRAKNKSGKDVEGYVTANTRKDALELLARGQIYPSYLEDAKKGEIELGKWFVRRPPQAVIAAFLQQLSDLLENGVPVLTAFQVLAKQTTHPVLKKVIEDIQNQIADGQEIDLAFESHSDVFDDLTISIIRAGAEGAFLEDALKRTSRFMEQQAELRGRVIGAMIYPTILCVVGVVIVTVLLVFFVPKFEPMFETLEESGKPLPTVTVLLLAFKQFCGDYGLWVAGSIFAMVVWLRIQLRTRWGRRMVDEWKLKLPLVGPVALNSCVSRLCRVLGTLLENGVPILRALEISSHSTGNMLLTDAVEKSVESVAAGEPLSKPLAESGIMPPQVMAMISIAEESNNLENVLVNVADGIERQLAKKLDVMVRLLEPIMLLIMAGAVFYIIVALLLPVFQMTQAV